MGTEFYRTTTERVPLRATAHITLTFYLPKKLDRYLSNWVGRGVYHAIFDNVDDTLSLPRLQCFASNA